MREYTAKLPIEKQTSINRVHRCTDACKYFVSSKHHVAVCTESLHTHVCGRSVCTLATKTADTTYACPITGLEIFPPDEHQHVSLRSGSSFDKSSKVHWSIPRRRIRVPVAKLQRQVVLSTLKKLFVSTERQNIFQEALTRRDTEVSMLIQSVASNVPKNSYWTYLKIRSVMKSHAAFTRPPMNQIKFSLVNYMCQTINLLKREAERRRLPLKKNDACIVFGLVQLFDVGFFPGGVAAIRPVPCISAHGLSPCQYPKLPDLRARQQTIAVRQIQRICVDDTGRTVLQLPSFSDNSLSTQAASQLQKTI